MAIRYDGRVAIVTGAGNGLGREHCLQLAERGAKIVVNDFGGSVVGDGGSVTVAEQVVDEILSRGGEAIANSADVTNALQVEEMVAEAKSIWGRVDLLVNNAGILRDKSFSKMELSDFHKVVDVHLWGAVNCCKAVWNTMRSQQYGRIVMTSSSSGLFGNFGQANYGAAKAGLVGLMNVLHHEGAKYDIRVNALAPAASTRMLKGLLPDDQQELMAPALVSPGVLFLLSENAPSKTILGAGAGCFSVVRIVESEGVYLGGEKATVDDVAANWEKIKDISNEKELDTTFSQINKFVELASYCN